MAIIGGGIDYTQPAIAQMLARDGEGEITGYDFVDDDRRPYATGQDTRMAEIIVDEGQATTLIALRASAADAVSLAKAIGYAAKSPSKILAISLPLNSAEQQAIVLAAAQRFPQHLFVVAGNALNLPELPNVLVVAAAQIEPADTGGMAAPQSPADLAISIDGAPVRQPALAVAVARVSALAGRRRAVEPDEDGPALKQTIIRLATPAPQTLAMPTRYGWIAEPRRHFWLE